MLLRKAVAAIATIISISDAPAVAQERNATIGISAPPASFDPHYFTHAPSFMVQMHVYQSLVWRDRTNQVIPSLAERWEMLPDGAGWDFHISPDARFSDGTPVTATDVAATFARLPNVPNSPGRLTIYTNRIRAVEVLSDSTVRLLTHGPAPLLPEDLIPVMIVPAKVAQEATTQDFNSGRAAIGSGPYRLLQYTQGERISFDRNPHWRGPSPAFGRVTMRIIANDAARVAALRAGDVQLIDNVPPRDLNTISGDPNVQVWRSPGTRLVYVAFDLTRDNSPGVADAEGRPMERNPLKDVRVRRALSLAINREAIRDRVMEGQSAPAGQMQAIGLGVGDPGLGPDPFDPERARALLAEAGWGQGFTLVLAGPNDRLINDERILQAIGGYWQRIGVRTRVEAVPSNVFFPRHAQRAYSASMASWGGSTYEPNSIFAPLLLTQDRTRGWGTVNRHLYSNPAVDELYSRAVATLSQAERIPLWREAMRLAMADVPIMPIHHQLNIWATRRGFTYEPRADEYTLATSLGVAD